jgi:hypothetical protein
MDVVILTALVAFGVVGTLGWLIWILAARPFALSAGLIRPTADDLVVRGWKAEREGRWADALTVYDEALRKDKRHADAQARRAALLERVPELAREPPTASL